MGSLLVSCLIIILALIALFYFLYRARGQTNKRPMFQVEPGGFLAGERLTIFRWIYEQVPQGYYACPAVRLQDAFFRPKDNGLSRFILGASPLATTILDAVIVSLETGKIVAVVQQVGDERMGLIERTADDAGVPVIEGQPGNHIPWETIIG